VKTRQSEVRLQVQAGDKLAFVLHKTFTKWRMLFTASPYRKPKMLLNYSPLPCGKIRCG
jgi:hypothetical protein